MIPVDKNVPRVESTGPGNRRTNAGRPPIYPWRKMEVGDSFLLPPKYTTAKQGSSLTSVAAKYTGCRFEVRLVEHEGTERVRVWRVE